MSEWHVTPDYIVNNWTDELFNLMMEKLTKRKKREMDAVKGHSPSEKVSDAELFEKAHGLIKVVKKDAD